MTERFSYSMRILRTRLLLSIAFSPIILFTTGLFTPPVAAYASTDSTAPSEEEVVTSDETAPTEIEEGAESTDTSQSDTESTSASEEVIQEAEPSESTQDSTDEEAPAEATADTEEETVEQEPAEPQESDTVTESPEATTESDVVEEEADSSSPTVEESAPSDEETEPEEPAVQEPELTVITTNGGDDSSYQVPLSDVVVFFGETYDSIYATTNAVITFGSPDGTYWDYPQTPSISLGSQDWVAYPSRGDEHFIISHTDSAFQVDMSARPYGASTSVEPSRLVLSGTINEDRTVNFSYYLENTEQYGNLRFGVRTPDGQVLGLEESGFNESEEAPSEENEILPPAPEPEPEPEPIPEPEPEPEPDPVLNAPSSVSAVANEDGSVTLSWAAPEYVDTDVERYAIFWSDGSGGWATSSTETSATITAEQFLSTGGLDVEYSFRIRSDNDTEAIYSSFSEDAVALPTVAPEPEPEPEPTPAPPEPEPTPTPAPEEEVSPEPPAVEEPSNPQPTPEPPAPQPSPSPEPEPAPEPEPDVEPQPTPEPSPEAEEEQPVEESSESEQPVQDPEPAEEPTPEPDSSNEPFVSETPTPQPVEPTPPAQPENLQPESASPKSELQEPLKESTEVPPEPPLSALENPESSIEEKVEEIIKNVESGKSVNAQVLFDNGITFDDLPPETPVEVREDENGNAVVIDAKTAAALAVLKNPVDLVKAVFENPEKAVNAVLSIGKDMSEEEREESQQVVVAAIIVGNIANLAAQTAASAAAAAAAPGIGRRKP